MKFLCTKDNINNGLALVSHVATKNTSLPILNNILLKLSPRGLELTATNLEVAVTTIVRGKSDGEAQLAVQGRLLAEAASLLPGDKVEVWFEGPSLKLVCGRSHSTIKGAPADDFPVIPLVKEDKKFTTSSQSLGEAVSRVVFAISQDDGRPEIGGVFWANINNKLVLVGTDSYRLAESTVVFNGDTLPPDGVVVPLRATQEVGRISQLFKDDEVEVLVGENQIVWRLGETQIISRLVSGRYPDYLQIIPKKFVTEVFLDKDQLQQAVKAAALFVRGGINDVKLKIDPNTKTMLVSSNNSQLGENTTEIQTRTEGESTEIVFNYRYLLDGLSAITSKEIKISLSGANNPSLFEPKEVGNYRYLIMPIRQ